MDNRRELAKQVEKTLYTEIGRLKDYHAHETKLWQEVKLLYEARAEGHIAKIRHLKTALDQLKEKIKMGAKQIRTLLHSHRDRFLRKLKEAMNRGWIDKVKHAMELHIRELTKQR